MKLTTGALDGQQWDNPQTGMVLQVEATDCFWLVLHLGSVLLLVACGKTWTLQRLHRQSNSSRMAHQYVLLPEGLLCLAAQSLEHGRDSRRQAVTLGELDWAVEGPVSAPMCKEEQAEHWQSPTKWPLAGHWCECLWPNNQKQTSWGWPEGPTSSNGPCAHCPAPWSSIGICHWTLELAGLPLAPCAFHRWEQVHPEHMWQTWKGLEKPWGTLCCL